MRRAVVNLSHEDFSGGAREAGTIILFWGISWGNAEGGGNFGP